MLMWQDNWQGGLNGDRMHETKQQSCLLRTQLWQSSMSQSLPTILLHTQKYVLLLHKEYIVQVG